MPHNYEMPYYIYLPAVHNGIEQHSSSSAQVCWDMVWDNSR